MRIAWGLVVTVLASLAWGGQTLSSLAPSRAVSWGLMEAEADVEPTFWADAKAEARWDMFTLWTMVVAGVLLIGNHRAWPYFGLTGGGMYLYFAGRGILARRFIQRAGLRVGAPRSVTTGLVFLALWGAMAAVTIGLAVDELRS